MFVETMLNEDGDDPLLYLRTLCLALDKTKVYLSFISSFFLFSPLHSPPFIAKNYFYLISFQNVLIHSLKKYSSLGVDFGTFVNSVFCNYQDEYVPFYFNNNSRIY